MSGFAPFLRKELTEIVRTWRIWVLPLILLFLAVTGTFATRYTKELLESAGGAGDMPLQLPDPTALDSYAAWVNSLTQNGFLALFLTIGGVVNGEVRSGTASLVLTKPVSRASFVLAKLVSQLALVLGSVLLGSLVTWALTAVLFPTAPAGPMLASTAVSLVLSALLVCLTVCCSAFFRSGLAAAGTAFGLFLACSLLSLWAPARRWSPAGLLSLPGDAARDAASDWVVPVLTGTVLAAALAFAAVRIFQRKEI